MSDAFKKILANVPRYVTLAYASSENAADDVDGLQLPARASLVLSFGETDFGFGELTFVQDATGQLFLDTEQTSLAKVKEFLAKWVDSAILDTDEDPVRHKRYNEVRGRRCGEGCRVCAGPK